MRNPATVFAKSIPEAKWELWADLQGNQVGLVRLGDGTLVEEWELFRANQPSSSVLPTTPLGSMNTLRVPSPFVLAGHVRLA